MKRNGFFLAAVPPAMPSPRQQPISCLLYTSQTMFESSSISHIVENFRICAAGKSDDFDGTDFGDGDFYKWMEAAVYTAAQTGNQALFRQIEEYIAPVSYTHLDVYKRQHQCIPGISQKGNAATAE